MRNRHIEIELEDLSAQAGWMYADLFLALMVVFLATISFVPEFSGSSKLIAKSSVDGSTVYSYINVYPKKLDILYENFDEGLIKDDLNHFLSAEKLPIDTQIIFGQFIAGYDAKAETPATAISRALRFSQSMDNANSSWLVHAATTLSSSKTIKSHELVLRLTFASRTNVNGPQGEK